MIRHSIFCQRQWGQLAWTVKSGVPAPRHTSLLGALADNQSFILGMNSIASRIAGPLADEMDKAGLLTFRHMLDLGGASGTYAKVFLDRIPNARATVFDLPIAIHEAEKMFKGSPYESRIQLCEGDFYRDEFPTGFDFIWISAIIHQQDDDATRTMFEKSFRALVSGGKIAIRDVYINQERTGPPAAVFFAVNMLCNTEQGKVYTQGEVFRLLEEAGFKNPALVVPADDMRAVIVAQKP